MKYIAYYRVSTQKQGISGLGLKAQKEAVENYIAPDMIYKSFTEIETGTSKRNRPILAQAIALCRELDATLIIAKLDRLARNVAFVSSLMDSKVKFKAVDMPEANELTIHILSAVAKHEAKLISTLIKDALAQSEKKLGNPQNLTREAQQKGLDAIKRIRDNNENRTRALAFLKGRDLKGITLQKTADLLNENRFYTSSGKRFTPTQVFRLKKQLAEAS